MPNGLKSQQRVFQDDTLTPSLSTISLDSAMRQELEANDNPILFQIKKKWQ